MTQLRTCTTDTPLLSLANDDDDDEHESPCPPPPPTKKPGGLVPGD